MQLSTMRVSVVQRRGQQASAQRTERVTDDNLDGARATTPVDSRFSRITGSR
jgi:hypothetical protein